MGRMGGVEESALLNKINTKRIQGLKAANGMARCYESNTHPSRRINSIRLKDSISAA